MKRLLEEDMDKKRAHNFKRAGIEETEPKTYGEKYKNLFARAKLIRQN